MTSEHRQIAFVHEIWFRNKPCFMRKSWAISSEHGSDARAAPWHKVARHSERGGAVTDRGARGRIGEKRRQITRQSRVVRRAPRGESLGTNSPNPCLNSNIHHHTFPNHWHHHTSHCGGLHIVSPTRPPLKRHWFGVMDGRKPWAWKDDFSPTRGSVGVGASRSQCELALLPPWTSGFEQTAT